MELFRPAGLLQADPDSRDWTRDHGYAQVSSFPFPRCTGGGRPGPVGRGGPRPGPPSSTSACSSLSTMSTATLCPPWTWWKTSSTGTSTRNPPGFGATTPPRWGEIRLEIFYDMGLFHREDTAPAPWPWNKAERKKQPARKRTHERSSAPTPLKKATPYRTPSRFGNCSAGAGSTPCSWNPPPIR